MKAETNLLLNALCHPAVAISYSLSEWDQCIRMARHSRVLARLFLLIDNSDNLKKLDPKVCDHLNAAHAIAAQHERIVRWEAGRIEQALEPIRVPIVLLKGAAYLMAGLPPAKGRLYSDIDIMVPFNKLGAAESALLEQGWEYVKPDPYDERYYRKWMHELPPLQHKDRKTIVDLHHTILPRTGRLHPDPQLLFENALRIGDANLWTLSPADMILHSAAHLFQDGDLAGGLRDLIDLDDLFRYFGSGQESFWAELIARGASLDLARPLFYAFRYSRRILGTPIPEPTIRKSEFAAPPKPVLKLMDTLVCQALLSSEPVTKTRGAAFARWCLYVRSHYLRMPPFLLFFHLLRKATKRFHSSGIH